MALNSSAPDTDAIAEELAQIFSEQTRLFSLGLSKTLAREKVSLSQYCLLGILSARSQMSMSEIATSMKHTTAAATGLVDRLENLGCVRRVQTKEDRRKVWVEITERGMALVGEMRDGLAQSIRMSLSYITAGEQLAWLEISRKIYRNHQFT